MILWRPRKGIVGVPTFNLLAQEKAPRGWHVVSLLVLFTRQLLFLLHMASRPLGLSDLGDLHVT